MSFLRSSRSIAALILILGVSVPAFSGGRAGPHPSRFPQSDLESGKQMFETSCASCHGFDAGGGQGPNIQRAPANRGDDEVVKIIKNGVPGTGMPALGGPLPTRKRCESWPTFDRWRRGDRPIRKGSTTTERRCGEGRIGLRVQRMCQLSCNSRRRR